MTVTLNCQHCGKPFNVGAKEAHRVFCSRECYHAQRRENPNSYQRLTPTHRNCVNCGTEFSAIGRNLNAKFCSAACRETYTATHGLHGQRKTLTCAHCAKEFTASPKEIRNGRKYCSMACYSASLTTNGRPEHRVEPVIFACHTCGKPFQRNPGELKQYRIKFGKDPMYCSRECSHIGRTRESTRVCPVCETVFSTSGISKSRNETCSDPCRRALQRRKLIERNERVNPSANRQIQRRFTKQGYVMLRFPNIGGVKGREVLEHRLVLEKRLGRELLDSENGHHINGQRADNRDENIELWSMSQPPGQRVEDKVVWCIEMLTTYADFTRRAGFELVKLPDEGH